MKVAYFTAGTVGAGHFVRGVAIERALRRAGSDIEYRMFGPALPFAAATRDDYHTVPIVEAELCDPERAPTSELAAALTGFAPDLLLVDMFWAPLRYILPLPGCESWLLVRSCPRQWFVGPPAARYDAGQFARVIAIEPHRHAAIGETIEPVVIANPDECRPPGALREHLGMPEGRPLTVVTHAGVRGEVQTLAGDAQGAATVRLDLFDPAALFPLAEWLPGADEVISAAGYNAFWEAQWLGYATRTRFTPLRRSIDDQPWRVHACGSYVMRANGADVLAEWMRGD